MKALGRVVSENKIFMLSHCSVMGANDPQGKPIFYPRGMICRIYGELFMPLLHTKYRSFGSCAFGEEEFSLYFHFKPMADYDAPLAWPV